MTVNKVTHIVNCAARQIPCHWEPIGVKYLAFPWLDAAHQVVLDARDLAVNACFHFIEEALGNTTSALIHSVRGQNRACSLATAYLMRKYRWTLVKALEFLNYRKPTLEIAPAFLQQLMAYERRLLRTGLGPKTSSWAGSLVCVIRRGFGSFGEL